MKYANNYYKKAVFIAPDALFTLDGSTYTRKRKNARAIKYGAIVMGLILVVMHLISWGWV